jgi:hypothetical protein
MLGQVIVSGGSILLLQTEYLLLRATFLLAGRLCHCWANYLLLRRQRFDEGPSYFCREVEFDLGVGDLSIEDARILEQQHYSLLIITSGRIFRSLKVYFALLGAYLYCWALNPVLLGIYLHCWVLICVAGCLFVLLGAIFVFLGTVTHCCSRLPVLSVLEQILKDFSRSKTAQTYTPGKTCKNFSTLTRGYCTVKHRSPFSNTATSEGHLFRYNSPTTCI